MSSKVGDSELAPRVVVAAANRLGDYVVVSARHFDPLMHAQIKALGLTAEFRKSTQGFIDQYGTFMDRFEALAVATAQGQIHWRRPKTHPTDRLFSEDLY